MSGVPGFHHLSWDRKVHRIMRKWVQGVPISAPAVVPGAVDARDGVDLRCRYHWCVRACGTAGAFRRSVAPSAEPAGAVAAFVVEPPFSVAGGSAGCVHVVAPVVVPGSAAEDR